MDFGLVFSGAVQVFSGAIEVITDPVALEEKSRMFGVDSQLLWQVIPQLFNVILLFVIMYKLLYKPVTAALAKRTDKIEGQLAEAEEERNKAKELRELYEKKAEDAMREREEVLAEARKLAQEASAKLVGEAKREADSIRERSAANVEMEWQRAQSEMRTAIIDISATMASKFVSLAINRETHDKLFDETMADLENIVWTSPNNQ